MLTFHGDILLENEDSKELAKEIYAIINRLHTVYSHLNRIGVKRPNTEEPSGDID